MSAQRTAAPSQSFTVAFSSPPTYWIGFCTEGSSGSSRANTDSTGITADTPDVADRLRVSPQAYARLRRAVGGVDRPVERRRLEAARDRDLHPQRHRHLGTD